MSTRALNLGPMLMLGASLLLAILLGVALANPQSFETILSFGAILGLLAIPFLIRHHQLLVILLVNAPINAFFIPGQPDLWAVLAFGSLVMTVLAWGVEKEFRPQWNMRVGWPLLVLLAVVLVTAQLRGGLGGRAFGSGSWGGMRYALVISAIIAFFAISARPLALNDTSRIVSGYFLSGLLSVFSNLIYIAGPSFFFLFNVFASEVAAFQLNVADIQRYTGFAWAALAVMYWLLMKYGIRGISDLSKSWRILLFTCFLGVGLLGGFRSTLIMLVIVLAFQFVFERLYSGRHLLALAAAVVLTLSVLIAVGDRLPLSIQRSLSFLPIKFDPIAKQDAAGTLEWRLDMWKIVVPEIPRYLWLGKGFSFSGTDYYLTNMAVVQGRAAAYEDTLISGNYHHGILTLIIPFGLAGMVAFTWFAWQGWWLLFRNYRLGSPSLLGINTFLLSYYSARLLFYLTFYGQFDLDIVVFTSCVGLSSAINRPSAKPVAIANEQPTKFQSTSGALQPV